MNLQVVNGKSEIADLQKQLERTIEKYSYKSGGIIVGTRAGSERLKVFWLKNENIWFCSKISSGVKIKRYWNTFGINEPKWDTNISHSIICEINIPLSGFSRRIAGTYVKDEKGKIYLAHDGSIGGGKKGIGRELFKNSFRGNDQWMSVCDNKGERETVVITSFKSGGFIKRLGFFVREVARIKGKIDVPQSETITIVNDYSPEHQGKKKYKTKEKQIETTLDHGLIVDELSKAIKLNGFKLGKNKNIDLCLLNSNDEIVTIYEVKTTSILENYYKAIGQLLYRHQYINQKQKPKLVAVFPKTIDKNTVKLFENLNIICLTYEYEKDKVIFDI